MSEMTNTSQNKDDTSAWTVSVVIPAYNAGQYIGRALDSVLGQTQKADEIIVVDDGSTDETAAIVAKYADRVKYIRQENRGASAARNTGIKAAGSEWVAFLDGDDEWLGEKLQKQIELLQRNPELNWCTGNFIRCLCEERRQGPDLEPRRCRELLGGKEYFENYFQACMVGATGHTNMTMIKRVLLEEVGGFREEQKRFNDMDMWFRINYRSPRVGYVPEALIVYHLDVSESISRRYHQSSIYGELIERHLKLAADWGQSETFKPCAAHLLRGWMRAMLFEAQGEEIRRMLEQFDDLLPGGYKSFMRLLTTFPRATAGGCHFISRLVRTLRLRRKPVRKPPKNI